MNYTYVATNTSTIIGLQYINKQTGHLIPQIINLTNTSTSSFVNFEQFTRSSGKPTITFFDA